MKNFLLLILCLVTFASASAAEIEARLLRFTYNLPPTNEIIRLIDCGAIQTATSFSARLDRKGQFMHKAVKAVQYPTEFDARGNPVATEKRETGICLSGRATAVGTASDIQFQFWSNDLASTIFYPTKNGITITQPFFRRKDLKTEVTLEQNTWILFRLADNGDPFHTALLLRVHK